MKVEIDKKSGFCFGVVYAIEKAEQELKKGNPVYCLGDIVHNEAEVERLRQLGLQTIDHEQLAQMRDCKVLIRAHGEPPSTYQTALANNIQLMDASCPVVLKLQNDVRKGFEEAKKIQGQVVIYGKHGHAEVTGLVGQTDGEAIVISSVEDLDKIDFTKPINLFSQTTKSLRGYAKMTEEIERRMQEAQGTDAKIQIITNDTICRQVSHREPGLQKFAAQHDVIVFVSGKKSSNGKSLHQVCESVNPRSYLVADVDEVLSEWFADGNVNTVGVCGATSTPMWLMEKVRDHIEQLAQEYSPAMA